MEILNDIKNYILYLKKSPGLSISLHTPSFDRILLSEELSAFNLHTNSYCSMIKSCKKAHEHCLKMQGIVAKHAKHGAFEGLCFAGVREFVFPIEKCGGFISVSGFRSDLGESYVEKTAEKYGLSLDCLNAAYATLPKCEKENEIRTLIAPLRYMLSEAYRTADVLPGGNSFVERVKEYIKLNRTKKITTSDICKSFSCSRSYISRRFKESEGISIGEYITKLRLRDAEFLLQNSDMNITEIAFSVGFSDSNYFSSVFAKEKGMPPRAYRKIHRL